MFYMVWFEDLQFFVSTGVTLMVPLGVLGLNQWKKTELHLFEEALWDALQTEPTRLPSAHHCYERIP